ncbi:PREDICTED: ribosomal RNA processing protein 1 homolog [Polistes dominula]|uniref:Ribosomal RNA processing protein 1 homolog n=1 Tax=Polistes dominula TaxID=743375 RepID=A0ABM1INK7_POLDO|nr:PREDICTED: ribosomal RNA processing protein 1 homolog [Polistes dominula]
MAIKKAQRHTRGLKKRKPDSFKNNDKQKQEKKIKVKNKKALIIQQEIKFVRLLSCNDKRIRDKVLKSLKKWLTVRSKSSFEFIEEDFMRLWKGLFYCMWMADKPLNQEELAESLSKIIHCFDSMPLVLLYIKSTLKTLAIEWFGIDQYRLDKFAMLVRRIFRQIFKICHDKNWDMEWVEGLMKILQEILIEPKYCLGFKMHVTELYWEEIAKVSNGNVPEDVVTRLVEPFIAYLAVMGDERLIRHVMRHIFRYLIFQSDVGMDYKEKFEAWRKAGFPCKSIDEMQKIEESDEENEEDTKLISDKESTENTVKVLDPRAGRVDVELPQINFNAKNISEVIKLYKFHPSSTTKSRRQIARLIDEFVELSQGKMPIGVQQVELVRKFSSKTDSKKAALRLLKFNEELYSDSNESKRKRKRNGQSDESLIDELEEEINTDKDITLERNNKKLNKKKKLHQDIKNHLDESNQTTTEESCSKDLKINNKNKQKKRIDQIENKTLKLINEKNTTKNIIMNKLKKIKNNVCGHWEISDYVVPINDNQNKINNSSNEEIDKSILNDKNDETLDNKIIPLTPGLDKSMNSTENTDKQNKLINELGQKKRVKIVLQRNTAQHTSDYLEQIKQSPAIPFDANKKPPVGVLKASPIPSPINPFYYKKKYKTIIL